jgi:hypothetical protein
MGLSIQDIPMVFQYNKRDLSNLLTVEELEEDLNQIRRPSYESSAVNGMGVFDTLKGISRLTLQALKAKIAKPTEPIVQPVSVPSVAAPAQNPAPPRPAAIRPAMPPPEVEFDTRQTRISDQELAKTTPKIKTVATSAVRVASELDRIRESLLGPILAPARPKVKDLTPALEDLKKASQGHALPQDVPIEVPREVLEDLKTLQLDLQFLNGRGEEVQPIGLRLRTDQMQRTGDGWLLHLKILPKKG